jgi:hypothetical protein
LDYAECVFVFVGRVAAALAGFAIAGLALFSAVWVLVAAGYAAQWPASHSSCHECPGSWGELADRAVFALTFASTDAVVFAAGVALIGYGTERRWPRWRTLRRITLGSVLGTAGLMTLALVSS